MPRFNDDTGGRAGSPADYNASASPFQRGGQGAEAGMLSSSMPGDPHSSRGFRKALEKTQRTTGRLKDQLPDKVTFGGKGYKKPNYFAQGARRHGMHIGSGAPATTPANIEGSDFGGGD